MICNICKQQVKNTISLGLHLKNIHNITSKEYYDKYFRKENEGICPECGKETSFQGMSNGYLKFCCPTCAQLNKETRNKYKCTCLNKYGAENVFSSEYGKQKIKETNLSNRGVEYPQQSKEVREKGKQTKLIKYGDENYNNWQKAHQTCLNKYGVSSYSKTDEFKQKLYNKVDYKALVQKGLITKEKICNEKIKEGYIPIQQLFKYYGNSWYKNKIVPIKFYSGTGFVTEENEKFIQNYYNSKSGRTSQEELYLLKIIKKYYKGNIIHGCTRILNHKELDIYIPDLNIAFEYNGCYWHSDIFKEKDCHFNKSMECLNKKIRLIHIYSYEEWDNIEIFIKNLFNKTENISNDFNKYSPLQFNYTNITFSGPEIVYTDDRLSVYGSGIFTLKNT